MNAQSSAQCKCPPAAAVAVASPACSSGTVCNGSGTGSGSGLRNACAGLHGSCSLRTLPGCESGGGAARPTSALSSACACCTSPCSAVLWPFMASNRSLKLLSCSCVSRAVISAAQAILAVSAAQAAPGGRGLERWITVEYTLSLIAVAAAGAAWKGCTPVCCGNRDTSWVPVPNVLLELCHVCVVGKRESCHQKFKRRCSAPMPQGVPFLHLGANVSRNLLSRHYSKTLRAFLSLSPHTAVSPRWGE